MEIILIATRVRSTHVTEETSNGGRGHTENNLEARKLLQVVQISSL